MAVRLTWTNNSSGHVGQRIRERAEGGTQVIIADIGPLVEEYIVADPMTSPVVTDACYTVSAYDEDTEIESDEICITTFRGDPLWSNVESLLHFDVPGTTFEDETENTWTEFNGAQIVSDSSAFGGAHGDFTSSNDDYIDLDTGTEHHITGAFTIEMRITPTSTDANIFWFGYDGGLNIWMFTQTAGQLNFHVFGSAFGTSAPISAGQTYHVAIDRDDSDNLRFFVDGSLISSRTSSGTETVTPIIQLGGAPALAGNNNGGRCFIDEFRMTVGANRYNEAFTPPTEPFPGEFE